MHYQNPILFGDYSDPDVIRVGEDFYMVSSSFTYVPGLPVLHSRDLVHWELIGYAAERLPFDRYVRPAHRCGLWAPAIRYHQGQFYIYACMPDEGLLAFTAADPAGKWECHVVKEVCGWIDPCPLFDEDGRAWLIHGFAASRCGINNLLYIHEMSADGLRILDKGRLVYNGADHGDETVEGPKLYRREGTYWILCPAGGVAHGYQLALRASSVFGPYERRVVLRQGNTPVNGPHQGGWVTDGRGGDWFIHFQDIGPYGRVPHLQPVRWRDGWPEMGRGGEPVPEGEVPLPAFDGMIPESDDFREGLGRQWQWQANPDPAWFEMLRPGLRLHAAPAENPYHAGAFLSQIMQRRDFDMEVRMKLCLREGDEAGIGMIGRTWHAAAVSGGQLLLRRGEASDPEWRKRETVRETLLEQVPWPAEEILLQMRVRQGRGCFFYGLQTESLRPLGDWFPLSPGGWTAARPGLFCLNRQGRPGGWADIRYVHIYSTISPGR